MYDNYDTYSKEEVLNALIKYIDHVGQCEGVSFLSARHKTSFEPITWEILTKADNDANDYDLS